MSIRVGGDRTFDRSEGIALRRWRLRNFKSVRSAEVELRPLTVVVGANSAGKSTLLQSIRAASQATRSAGHLYSLNGPSLRLGTVAELRHRGPENDDGPLVIGADFDILDRRSWRSLKQGHSSADALISVATLSWEVTLSDSPLQMSVANIEQLRVDLKPNDTIDYPKFRSQQDRGWLLATAETPADAPTPLDDDGSSSPSSFTGQSSGANGDVIEVSHIMVHGGFPREAAVMRPLAEALFEEWREELLRGTTRDREPTEQDLLSEADAIKAATRDLLSGHDEVNFERPNVSEAMHFFRRMWRFGSLPKIDLNMASSETFRDAVLKELAKNGVQGNIAFPHNLGDLGRMSLGAASFLRSRIRYLGPLREEPRPAYLDSPEGDDGYVGPRGEFTASVLQRHGDREVRVPIPDDNGVIQTPQNPVPLVTAVSLWANYLDIGESFSVSDEGRFGILMQVRQTGVTGALDLTSVGTGVSQLLPVIVMCLEARPGSLLLVEQPELHLNPKVQQRLADFLLAIAQSGRNLIVETHSEYLISRLRRRVAEDDSNRLQDTIGIYFAQREHGATTYNLVQQNEYGGIDEWPENFFDHAIEEEQAILSAAIKKRRAHTIPAD